MARRVIWSRFAVEDLRRIKQWLKDRGVPERAKVVLPRLRAAASSLADMPFKGKMFLVTRVPDIRELVVLEYRLLYRVRDEEIQVLNVYDQHQDVEQLIQDREEPIR